MRLWPPASSLASSLWRASRSRASLTVPTEWYSNWAGYMVGSPLLLGLGGLDGLPDPLCRERHRLDMIHAESPARVHDGIDHRWRRGDRPRLPRALDSQRVHGCGRLGPSRLVVGQHVGLGQRVIHHAAGDELPRLVVVDGSFPQRLGHALGDAAMD